MKIFEKCAEINDLFTDRKEPEGRNKLIELIDELKRTKTPHSPLVNNLLREAGLYPYIDLASAYWADRFAVNAFKVDTGAEHTITLHREQSDVLRMLCEGKSVAVSAPTSFGKSFVIDAFITIRKPKNVVIIVPTIALMDETRRRLYRKFWGKYEIITTPEATLGERNLFVFPQERALGYASKLEKIDLLVIDEFYKASIKFDKERAPTLVNAIVKLGKIATQRYFLAPNISEITRSVFTEEVIFVNKMDFNTVVLREFPLYQRIGKDEDAKGEALLDILGDQREKSLVYAASYTEIGKVVKLLIKRSKDRDQPLLSGFGQWIKKNYGTDWYLANLVTRGIGIHNGQIHRSLSQIQIKLFEELQGGLNTLVSTSSIIEGVNTSAQNVIIWKNRRGGPGNAKLDTFTYKNIVGRGGRMFKHFVGNVYLLEEPPQPNEVQLEIQLPDSILGDIDEQDQSVNLSKDQIAKIIGYREEMVEILGQEAYDRLFKGAGAFQGGDFDAIKMIASDMKSNPAVWNGLALLHSDNPDHWDNMLYAIINRARPGWDMEMKYGHIVEFIKVISGNWNRTLPDLLRDLKPIGVDINKFFKAERYVCFKMSSLLHDVNILQKEILNRNLDVSGFVSKLSNVFLPRVVFQLEEFGLPRMISRKIHQSKLIDFTASNLDIRTILGIFHVLKDEVVRLPNLDYFDIYILENFFDGIGASVDSPQFGPN